MPTHPHSATCPCWPCYRDRRWIDYRPSRRVRALWWLLTLGVSETGDAHPPRTPWCWLRAFPLRPEC